MDAAMPEWRPGVAGSGSAFKQQLPSRSIPALRYQARGLNWSTWNGLASISGSLRRQGNDGDQRHPESHGATKSKSIDLAQNGMSILDHKCPLDAESSNLAN
eukprot:6472237-Amphidinium_carterae.3